MNFSYGIIGIVGVLAAISIGFIAMDPTDIIEPRVEKDLVTCELQWTPACESTVESLPLTATVSIPAGSAVPGCDETNECYLPFETSVAIGATVSWTNDDSAVHTVTGGTISDISSVFDSSLILGGDDFEFTFDKAGTYDYFCLVHPWMIGAVNVN